MDTNTKSKYRKYTSLISLVVVFLLLTVLMLALNFLSTQRFAKFTQALDISSQQGAITQQLSKNLFDINLYINTVLKSKAIEGVNIQEVSLDDLPQIALYKIEEIKEQRNLFSQGLMAFQQGGMVAGTSGQQIELSKVTNPAAIKSLAETQKIWTPYVGLLDNFIKDTQRGFVSEETSNYLVDYSRLYNQSLLTESNNLSVALNNEVATEAEILQYIQLGGIIAAFILFFSIIFGALRQLLQGDTRLMIARQQTTDILDTVNEGLFLLDKNLIVSDEYSRSLETIIHQKNLQGKSFIDLLHGMVSEKDLESAQLFIEQLYNPWVVEELIQDLNPLKRIKINLVDDKAVSVTRYLDFNFLRILEKGSEEVDKVFVSVVDVTDAVLLERDLAKAKEQHDRELEMLSKILSVDNKQLVSFISGTNKRIHKMNEILKQRSHSSHELREKANQLFREMHSLKGDASALGLDGFIVIAEKQEDLLKDLLQRVHLTGNDFIPFTVSLDDLLNLNQFINGLLEHLRTLGRSFDTETSSFEQNKNEVSASPAQQQQWKLYFEQYAQSIAQRHGKQVEIYVDGFDEHFVVDENFTLYKDIAVQLLKNAIVHGIETPETRVALGKTANGQIKLLLRPNRKGALCLGIEDDGQGIRLDALREKAVALGFASAQQAAQLSEHALYAIMLRSGVSTAKTHSEDAGRGVGMDIVHELVRSAHGRLSIVSEEDKFTRIVAIFHSANEE